MTEESLTQEEEQKADSEGGDEKAAAPAPETALVHLYSEKIASWAQDDWQISSRLTLNSRRKV